MDRYIQQLVEDLELCTGDSDTHPYGEYCDCGNGDLFPEDDLPSNDYDKKTDDGFPF